MSLPPLEVRRFVTNCWATPADSWGSVQVRSFVTIWAGPVPLDVTVAFHTSPGDIRTVKSKISSELLAPRKRTLTTLPFTRSVFVREMIVALPFWALK
jgi:hypothetical protein